MNMYIEILLDALREFYRKDAEKLFDDKKAIDERAMVGCVYRYMWCKLQQLGELDVDIDIEYNRSSNDYSGMDQEKGIVLCGAGEHSKPCLNEESCMKILKSEMLKKERSDALFFRPDIIIHVRKSNKNFLHVEFKKINRDKGKANKSGVLFDMAKVRYSTCKKMNYRYENGAVVLLQKDRFSIGLFRNGKLVGRWLKDLSTEDPAIQRYEEIAGKGKLTDAAYGFLVEGLERNTSARRGFRIENGRD